MALAVEEIIARLQAANGEHTPVLAVRDELDEFVSDPAALDAAVGPISEGGITTLLHTADLTVLRVAWTPGMSLYPHEHRMWAAIGMYGGTEDNAFYRRTPAGLQSSGGRAVHAGDVLVLGDDVVHAVANTRSGEHAVALHVYGGDFFATDGRSEWDPDSLEERPRDMARTGRLFAEANARWAAEAG